MEMSIVVTQTFPFTSQSQQSEVEVSIQIGTHVKRATVHSRLAFIELREKSLITSSSKSLERLCTEYSHDVGLVR